MKGVRAVVPDVPYRPLMYATPAQIGAPALWEQVGGQANAGRGIKVAVIDSGIYVTKDAAGNYAGNPCFNDAGYTMPSGYPKGDTRFTNKKVIVAARVLPPSDPPATGNDTPIQGPGASPHGTHVSGTVACNANTLVGLGSANHQRRRAGGLPHELPDLLSDELAGRIRKRQRLDRRDRPGDRGRRQDGADVLSNSWGSSHQNTLAWPDPMVEAAESAVQRRSRRRLGTGQQRPARRHRQPALRVRQGHLGRRGLEERSHFFVERQRHGSDSGAPAGRRTSMPRPANFGPTMNGLGQHIGPAAYVPVDCREAESRRTQTFGCPLRAMSARSSTAR